MSVFRRATWALKRALQRLTPIDGPIYFVAYACSPRAAAFDPKEHRLPGLLAFHTIALDDGTPAIGSYWSSKSKFDVARPVFEEALGVESALVPTTTGHVALIWSAKRRLPSLVKTTAAFLIALAAVFGAVSALYVPAEVMVASSDLSFEPGPQQQLNVGVGDYHSFVLEIVNHERVESDVEIDAVTMSSGDHTIPLEVRGSGRYLIRPGATHQLQIGGLVTGSGTSQVSPQPYDIKVNALSRTGLLRGRTYHDNVLVQQVAVWGPRGESDLIALTEKPEFGVCRYQSDLHTGRDYPRGLVVQASVYGIPVRQISIDGSPGISRDDFVEGPEAAVQLFSIDALTRYKTYRFHTTVDFDLEDAMRGNVCITLLEEQRITLEFSEP
jgi:hypothetical protein